MHPLKNTVPEPAVPESGGSSPKCGAALKTLAAAPSRQNPRSPLSRRAPHARGQSRQGDCIARASPMRRDRSLHFIARGEVYVSSFFAWYWAITFGTSAAGTSS